MAAAAELVVVAAAPPDAGDGRGGVAGVPGDPHEHGGEPGDVRARRVERGRRETVASKGSTTRDELEGNGEGGGAATTCLI